MAAAAISANAQNVQVHYDFGRHLYPDQEEGRQSVTMTLEQFKADKWGSWYYFVDVDFSNKFVEGAYTEISREFNIGKKGFAAHVEYNGGLSQGGGSFQQSALLGGAWNGHNDDFSTTYSVQLMYKRLFRSYAYTSAYHSFQLTGVWSTGSAQTAIHISSMKNAPFRQTLHRSSSHLQAITRSTLTRLLQQRKLPVIMRTITA